MYIILYMMYSRRSQGWGWGTLPRSYLPPQLEVSLALAPSVSARRGDYEGERGTKSRPEVLTATEDGREVCVSASLARTSLVWVCASADLLQNALSQVTCIEEQRHQLLFLPAGGKLDCP